MNEMEARGWLWPKIEDARKAAEELARLDTARKNAALGSIAQGLREHVGEILAENGIDVEKAEKEGKSAALVDRLRLDEARVEAMARTMEEVAELPDPVGELYDVKRRPNGLLVSRMRIPLGVIGIVFESRPNVVCDTAALCLKSGNCVILRGGSDAAHSNAVLGGVLRHALKDAGLPESAVTVIDRTDRTVVLEMLRARGGIDLLIPRGGESLIRFVDEHARVPVVLHFKGVCHMFVDRDADLDMAYDLALNAKAQRAGVCNALETLLVDRPVAELFLPGMAERFREVGVELRGCGTTCRIVPDATPATEEDWPAEYLDLVLAVKVVDGMDEALAHIGKYSSLHTESIVTEHYGRARRFLREVGSSCVLVNASTRFNDGGQLGLGAEMGISTTKIHAFGPMGLRELTTSKFVVMGDGQMRQ